MNENETTALLAARFYEQGKLSLGQAAEMAGYSKRTFMETLSDYGVSIFSDSEEDLDNDISNAGAYSKEK